MKVPRIYWVRPLAADGPWKVGFTTNLDLRLHAFRAASPVILSLEALLVLPADRRTYGCAPDVERRLHERYLPWHSHHEWFCDNELIRADVAAVKAGTFDVAALPPYTKATWHLPMGQPA